MDFIVKTMVVVDITSSLDQENKIAEGAFITVANTREPVNFS